MTVSRDLAVLLPNYNKNKSIIKPDIGLLLTTPILSDIKNKLAT
ncbi:MAG: hypothetical protein ACJA0T_002171 [Colwellia sp.]|jgi:hypothetical protein